jgi:tetratricopeptide (TPR) repeat protein
MPRSGDANATVTTEIRVPAVEAVTASRRCGLAYIGASIGMGDVGSARAAFAVAVRYHSSGRFNEAADLCRAILAKDRHFSDAMVLLGVVLCLGGSQAERAEAITLLRRALVIRPSDAQALEILGDAYTADDRLDDAMSCYRRAICLTPARAGLHSKLGIALNDSGRHADAIDAFHQAIAREPKTARNHFNLGVILKDAGQPDAAVEAYRQAIALDPENPDAYVNLGVIHMECGRNDSAFHCFAEAQRLGAAGSAVAVNLAVCLLNNDEHVAALGIATEVLSRDPACSDAHIVRGNVLVAMERHSDAVCAFEAAIALDPGSVKAYNNLGIALKELARFDEAVAAYRQALTLDPSHVDAHINLGVALQEQDQFDAALACYRQALAIDPGNAKALSNFGVALDQKGLRDASLDAYRRAAALAPDAAKIRFNLAVGLLRAGDMAQGWAEYEWRWRGGVRALKAPKLPQPLWDGDDLAGRTLLVHAEQGLGDTLQFVRYLPLLARRGARVVLVVPTPLERLLRSSLAGVSVAGADAPLPHFDVHLPLMSLPRVFRTDLDSIPAQVPYLAVDPAAVAQWRQRLGNGAALKVGVAWSGNPNHKNDRHRSIAAAVLLTELLMPGVQLYSVQKSARPADRSSLISLSHIVTDLAPRFGDLGDTAAALMALDLVITVDTSVAHLAGALGRPVWTLLPFTPDWRWLLEREDSPWYPTMRLYRQQRFDDWDDVFERLRADLRWHAVRHAAALPVGGHSDIDAAIRTAVTIDEAVGGGPKGRLSALSS